MRWRPSFYVWLLGLVVFGLSLGFALIAFGVGNP